MRIEQCRRCGQECQPGIGNPSARPLRRSLTGVCADCGITLFLRTTEPICSLLASLGPESLLTPQLQTQVGQILRAGQSDCQLSEINWGRVIANWHLPIRKGERWE